MNKDTYPFQVLKLSLVFLLLVFSSFSGIEEKFSRINASNEENLLENSSRIEKDGWILLHLKGKPEALGFQQGSLLAEEIDDAFSALKPFLEHTTHRDWAFYHDAARDIFWNHIEKEYQDELEGIAKGLRSKGKKYDRYDITALNGYMELSEYYVPFLENQKHPGSSLNKAPGNCSAFIANGKYTEDGKIVMGHNNWTDYALGERWNIILDIQPEKGNRIFMDAFPGFIHSGDDFAENSAGILITETTITQFNGFDTHGVPEFMRARKSEQYSSSIEDFIRIMMDHNNGAYANDWLVGDTKTNEIARLELGLKNHKVWKTKDGMFFGSNFALNPKLIREETNFNPKDSANSPNTRRVRYEKLMEEEKGKINIESGKILESDHFDPLLGVNKGNRCVICGHVDTDPKGCPEWDWAPFYPGGAVQGKLTTAGLASHFQFWAHMGHPCGEDFIASTFLHLHPEYNWQKDYLRDMKAYPWSLMDANSPQ